MFPMLLSDTVKFNLQLLLQVIRLQLTTENPIPYIGHKITPYGCCWWLSEGIFMDRYLRCLFDRILNLEISYGRKYIYLSWIYLFNRQFEIFSKYFTFLWYHCNIYHLIRLCFDLTYNVKVYYNLSFNRKFYDNKAFSCLFTLYTSGNNNTKGK